jgi:hypothetical protein
MAYSKVKFKSSGGKAFVINLREIKILLYGFRPILVSVTVTNVPYNKDFLVYIHIIILRYEMWDTDS